MSVRDFFDRVFGGNGKAELVEVAAMYAAAADTAVREAALLTATNLISAALAKCTFDTYVGGEKFIGDEHYLWNVRPNQNQNSSAFLRKMVFKLVRTGHALAIEINGSLYIADSFTRTPYALYDNRYDGVTLDGWTFPRPFYERDVLYFSLGFGDAPAVLSRLSTSWAELLGRSQQTYKRSRGRRAILKIASHAREDPNFNDTYKRVVGADMKSFMTNPDAMMPLYDGFDLVDVGSKTYKEDDTRDIRALADDVYDFTARGYAIPPSLMRGDVADTEKAVTNFLSFCVDPLCDMISEEATGKRYTKSAILGGGGVRIDTRFIQHRDLFDVAVSAEKLIGIGGITVNNLRQMLGEPPVPEEWANDPLLSLNFRNARQVIDAPVNAKPKGEI